MTDRFPYDTARCAGTDDNLDCPCGASDVVEFVPRVPTARRKLADYLRHLAEVIGDDMAECDPNAAMIVLTGKTHHEVLHVGNDAEPGFLPGAIRAAQSVYFTPYKTEGGHVRPRTHSYGSGKKQAAVVSISARATAPASPTSEGDET